MRHLTGALAALAALCALTGASAQPLPVNTNLVTDNNPVGGTVTTHLTFQSVLTANTDRHGCLIQNKSTDTLEVFFGPTASATVAKSIALGPATVAGGAGGAVNCNGNGILLQTNVAVTSLAADGAAYVVISQ